jgi:hypothetical protein
MNERECTDGIGDLKRMARTPSPSLERTPRAPDRPAARRTPRAPVGGLVLALLIAWGFLHVALTIILTARPVHH